jgi:hypothetical protein
MIEIILNYLENIKKYEIKIQISLNKKSSKTSF